MNNNDQKINDWVKDGTPSSEPVTTETPAASAAAEVRPTEQPRNPDGTFAPVPETPAEAPSAAATPAPAAVTATPPAGASAQALSDFISAMNGETPFQLPRAVKIPLLRKTGEVEEYVPLEDVLQGAWRARDYSHKTAALANQRLEAESRMAKAAEAEARLKAREAHVAEQERQYQEALKDPDKMAQYEEHVRAYQSNPMYRKMVDDALLQRETAAVNEVHQQQEEARIISQGADLAASWIQEAATRFPDVDPQSVRSEYARALQTGTATLDPREVERIYQQEAARAEKYRSPLRSEMQALKDQLAAITAAKSAEVHNAQTTHALNRAKVPPTAPVAGRPPAPALPGKGERFGMNELAERNAAWANQR